MNLPSDHRDDVERNGVDARRKRARRTALWMAAFAFAVYAAFLLSGVLAQ